MTVLEKLSKIKYQTYEETMYDYALIMTHAKREESINSTPTLKTHSYEFLNPKTIIDNEKVF